MKTCEVAGGGRLALVQPHASRATPVGTGRIGAREWFGALDLPWGTEVVSASVAVERHIDAAREGWSRPALRTLRPPRGTTPLLVEARAPRTVWVAEWGLVPWSLTSPVVGWAALLEWGRVRGSRRADCEDGDTRTTWERAHRGARWELATDVFACEAGGCVRHAGSFVTCVGADGAPIRVNDTVLFERLRLPAPYDGIALASAMLAVVSAVNEGTASLRRNGRAGVARRFEILPRLAAAVHPEQCVRDAR